jgi:hypothetical protein
VSTTLQPLGQLHKVAEVAQFYRCTVKSLMARIKDEGIETTKVKNRTYFTPAQFQALVESDKVIPAAESITTGTSKS